MHIYQVRPRRDRRCFDLISDVLPFGRLWYTEVSHAIGYAKFYRRSHDVVIRILIMNSVENRLGSLEDLRGDERHTIAGLRE
jgi:hypothetical protein